MKYLRLRTIGVAAACLLAAGASSALAGEARKPTPTCGACTQVPVAGAITTAPTFVVTGRGWGHGVGMSQWGAYGFAKHGWLFGRILTHYFTGTQLTLQPTTQVRVLLAEGRSSLVVSSKVAFRVRDGAGKVYKLTAGDVRLGPGLELKPKDAKKVEPLQGPLTFLPGTTPLRLEHAYRGSIQVSSTGKKLQAVNVVNLESYLYGVVPEEVPDDWPPEALKAQAVAARTYALATLKPSGTYDLYDDTRSQVYGGVAAERFSTTTAVDATAGQVVSYKGRPAVTYFFSTSGGRTASIQDAWPGTKPVPYLVSVPDPYDSFSPHHRWGPIVFSAKPLRRKLHLPTSLLDVRTAVNGSGRVTSITVSSPLGQLSVSGPDARQLLGLRSTWFRVGVLTLVRPPGAVTYGSAVRLTGTARGVSSPALQQRAGTGGWELGDRVTPAGDGSFAVVVKPDSTMSYRLTTGAATGDPLRIPVAAAVRLLPAEDPGSVRGTVRPAVPGTTVQIQRQDGADWTVVANAETDAQGAFRPRVKLTHGVYRATASPGRGLVTGMSPPLRIAAA